MTTPTSLSNKDTTAALEMEKEVYWMSAPKFAVVGTSTNPFKPGAVVRPNASDNLYHSL
jgi:hypothetical protein